MDIKFVGRSLSSTQAIEEYVERKLEKITKFFNREVTAEVTLKEEGEKKTVQFQIFIGKNVYRTIAENEDLYAAIDKGVDVLERQIVKAKSLKERKRVEKVAVVEDLEDYSDEFEVEDEIIKYQTYEVRPMDPEDAKIALKSHRTNNFLTFININTNKVNVIFKLKDGKNFGLVVPE